MACREELKYLISAAERELMLCRLRAVMATDPHSMPDGTYSVRTLYFDDVFGTAMQEAVSGAPHREKFRLRMYNGDTGFLRLEKKIKNYSGGLKPEAMLSEAECRSLISGEYAFLADKNEPLLWECYAKARSGGMQPRTVVEYTRAAFGCAHEAVRITVDSDIRVSRFADAFFEPVFPGVPVTEDNACVLEVKYDGYLPDYIRGLIGGADRTRLAFSKFAASRIFY